MRLYSLLKQLTACAYSRVNSFGLTSESDVFSEATSLVDSRFAFRVMFVDWSVGRSFWSVFKS